MTNAQQITYLGNIDILAQETFWGDIMYKPGDHMFQRLDLMGYVKQEAPNGTWFINDTAAICLKEEQRTIQVMCLQEFFDRGNYLEQETIEALQDLLYVITEWNLTVVDPFYQADPHFPKEVE